MLFWVCFDLIEGSEIMMVCIFVIRCCYIYDFKIGILVNRKIGKLYIIVNSV